MFLIFMVIYQINSKVAISSIYKSIVIVIGSASPVNIPRKSLAQNNELVLRFERVIKKCKSQVVEYYYSLKCLIIPASSLKYFKLLTYTFDLKNS